MATNLDIFNKNKDNCYNNFNLLNFVDKDNNLFFKSPYHNILYIEKGHNDY